jgi:hypothetical protein
MSTIESVELLFLFLSSALSYLITISSVTLTCILFTLLVKVEVIDPHIHIDVDYRSSLQSLPNHLIQPAAALHLLMPACTHERVGFYSTRFSF